MSTKKDVRKLLREVERNGFILRHGGKHLKILDPEGRFVEGVSATPNPSALKAIRHDLTSSGCL